MEFFPFVGCYNKRKNNKNMVRGEQIFLYSSPGKVKWQLGEWKPRMLPHERYYLWRSMITSPAEMMRAKYVFFLPFILPALCRDSPFLAYSHEDKKAKQEGQIIYFVKAGLKGVKSEPKMIEHKYKEKGRNIVSCMEKESIFKEQLRV